MLFYIVVIIVAILFGAGGERIKELEDEEILKKEITDAISKHIADHYLSFRAELQTIQIKMDDMNNKIYQRFDNIDAKKDKMKQEMSQVKHEIQQEMSQIKHKIQQINHRFDDIIIKIFQNILQTNIVGQAIFWLVCYFIRCWK